MPEPKSAKAAKAADDAAAAAADHWFVPGLSSLLFADHKKDDGYGAETVHSKNPNRLEVTSDFLVDVNNFQMI